MSEDIIQKAREFVRKNKKKFSNKIAPSQKHESVDHPITFFMAGSPGAGKTEVATNLAKEFNNQPVLIDPDAIRTELPGYTGKNAHLFQSAVTIAVDNLYKHCLKRNYNIILDGTFGHDNALTNIQLALDKKRQAEIFFVYQNPKRAWHLTQTREQKDHRRIRAKDFVETYFQAIKNVHEAKNIFKENVILNLIIKDFEEDLERFELNIDHLDGYIKDHYTEETLLDAITRQ